MNILSAIMGALDLICISIILIAFGWAWWTTILFFAMVLKGGMSFL